MKAMEKNRKLAEKKKKKKSRRDSTLSKHTASSKNSTVVVADVADSGLNLKRLTVVALGVARQHNAASKKVLSESVRLHARVNILQDQLLREDRMEKLYEEEEQRAEVHVCVIVNFIDGNISTPSVSQAILNYLCERYRLALSHPRNRDHTAKYHTNNNLTPLASLSAKGESQKECASSQVATTPYGHREGSSDLDNPTGNPTGNPHGTDGIHGNAPSPGSMVTHHPHDQFNKFKVDVDASHMKAQARRVGVRNVTKKLRASLRMYQDRQEEYQEEEKGEESEHLRISEAEGIISMFKSAAAGAVGSEEMRVSFQEGDGM